MACVSVVRKSWYVPLNHGLEGVGDPQLRQGQDRKSLASVDLPQKDLSVHPVLKKKATSQHPQEARFHGLPADTFYPRTSVIEQAESLIRLYWYVRQINLR
jgi:hypothetical protein